MGLKYYLREVGSGPPASNYPVHEEHVDDQKEYVSANQIQNMDMELLH